MPIVIFSDRDGTINLDENYYLGSKPNWKEQVSLLEGVVEGIKLINRIPDSHFFIVTNQSGVALTNEDFEQLTEERLEEVNRYIVDMIAKEGGLVDGVYSCPYVDSAYVEKSAKKNRTVDTKYVHDNHEDMKPNTGMMLKALTSMGLKPDDCDIYMIGDRKSDVQMGISIGGTGILVESFKTRELGDAEAVKEMDGKKYIAGNFLEAARYIEKQSNNTNL